MRRIVGMSAVVGIVAALTLTVTPAVVAAVGDCPPGSLPAPGPGNPIWTDENVAVYAGEDFLATAASAETEGLIVVAGDATFDRTSPGTFNVGWVGVGSGVAPAPGNVMLAVGGDLAVGASTVLDVGANAIDGGGDLLGGSVQVGGITTPDYEADGSRYRLNNGALTQEMAGAALTPWTGWGAPISAQSADFAALPITGTADVVGAFLTFAGDGTSARQVFRVTSDVLVGVGSAPAIEFTGIPDGASVIVDVTGTAPVTWAPNYFADDGVRADDLSSPLFGVVASRTLWNFAAAASVHLAGTSQVLGSILVPSAGPGTTIRVTASSNGRLYTNGSIVMDGTGNEHHNYPWADSPFECIPVTPDPPAGQASITKALSAEDAALLPAGTEFHGILRCVPATDPGVIVREWDVAPGETVVIEDLPVGATCTAIESIETARARAPLPGAPPGPRADAFASFVWQTPVWNPAPPTFVVPATTDPVQISLTVTNAIAQGGFTIEKVVTGVGAPATTFTGEWTCELPLGTTVLDGQWSLAAGEITDTIEAPVGAMCAVTEDTPPPVAGGGWGLPQITGSPFTVTPASATAPLQIVVENTFVSVILLGGFKIVKVVENPAGVAYSDAFSGAWSCSLGGTVVADGTWTATTSTSYVETGLPVGAVCTATENRPADPAGGTWGLRGSPRHPSPSPTMRLRRVR